jgi:hypothetical protein
MSFATPKALATPAQRLDLGVLHVLEKLLSLRNPAVLGLCRMLCCTITKAGPIGNMDEGYVTGGVGNLAGSLSML